MSVQAQVLGWIASTLNGDATINTTPGWGGVWDTTAPDDTSRPFFIIQVMAGDDVINLSGGKRIKSDLLIMVKAVGETSQYQTLETIYSRADTLLIPQPAGANLFPIILANVVILSSIRRTPHNLTYLSAGKLYTDLGGIYAIQAKT